MLLQALSIPGLWALLLAAAALMGSPGPSTMSLMASGAAFGLRRSLRYAAGLVAGTVLVLLAVAAGLAALLLSVPWIAPVLGLGAAAYMLILALRIARAPPLATPAPAAAAPGFHGGLLLAAANPKAYAALGTVFAGTNLGDLSPALEPVAKVAVLAAMVVLIHLVWLLAGASLARLLRHPMASRLANLGFALAMLAAGLAMAFG